MSTGVDEPTMTTTHTFAKHWRKLLRCWLFMGPWKREQNYKLLMVYQINSSQSLLWWLWSLDWQNWNKEPRGQRMSVRQSALGVGHWPKMFCDQGERWLFQWQQLQKKHKKIARKILMTLRLPRLSLNSLHDKCIAKSKQYINQSVECYHRCWNSSLSFSMTCIKKGSPLS